MSFDVPFIRPRFPSPAALAADFDEIVASNWYSNFGPREREFSSRIADYVGQGTVAVTVANATLGLMALIQAVLGRGGRQPLRGRPVVYFRRRPGGDRVVRLSSSLHRH